MGFGSHARRSRSRSRHAPANPAQSSWPRCVKSASLLPGAEVYRASDGVRIGRTPFHRGFERSDGELKLIVKLGGYRDARVVLSTARDSTESVKLAQQRTTTRVTKPPEGPSHPPGGSATTVLDPYKDP